MENNQLMKKQNGILRTINNLLEIIKSRVDKKYILSINSPEILKRDIKLIKRTLGVSQEYFSQIPTDLFFDEATNEYSLNRDGLLYWAFENGIELENMFESFKGRNDFSRIFSLYLDFKIQSKQEISCDYLEKIPPQLLKDKSIRDVLFPIVLQNSMNLEDVFKIFTKKGLKNYEIFDILGESAKDTILNNPQLFEKLLEYSDGLGLQIIVDKFFSKDELRQFFAREDLPERLKRLGELYKNDSQILSDLNPKMLSEKYKNIPLYKIQLISRIPELQESVLGLTEFELNLYTRMSRNISRKTDNWQEFENNILLNFKKGPYKQLIEDMQETAKQGKKISHEELEKLTNLFSGYAVNFDQENIFGIATREELKKYESIRDDVCDAILKNPQMDDEMLVPSLSKYMLKFRELSEIDRVKMAMLEKYYNLSLNEAMSLVKTFGQGIEDIKAEDIGEKVTIETIKAIKDICSCDDMKILRDMNNTSRISTELSQSVALRQEAHSIYENLYQESLYQVDECDRGEDTVYDGQNIKVYYPNTDFAMIVKRVRTLTDGNSMGLSLASVGNDSFKNYKDAWNCSKSTLRFKTSTSYMTPENLMYDLKGDYTQASQIMFGFAEGIGSSYSIDEMHNTDAVTPFITGDKLFREANGSEYKTPSVTEACTNKWYNELVINTVSQDENGNPIRMQPSYIVYIQENSQEDRENNLLWEESQKAAQQFGIPIVVLDREKIQLYERQQILEGCKCEGGKDDLKLMSKIWHYINRYGQDSLNKDVPLEIIKQVCQYSISPMQQYINGNSSIVTNTKEEQKKNSDMQEL